MKSKPIPRKVDNQPVTRGIIEQPPMPPRPAMPRIRHTGPGAAPESPRRTPRGTGTRSPL